MYRAYAQDPQARVNVGIRRRLAPLLGNDRKLIEMMNGLLFSMPGTPIIYYGDEIGMGDNIYLGDRNAVRTPDAVEQRPQRRVLRRQPPAAVPAGHHRPRVPLAGGQRRGPGGEPELAAVVDAAADRACASATRRSGAAPSRSCARTTARCSPSSAATRTSGSWCVVNLSRHVQCVELDLSEFRGAVPVELFGQPGVPAGRRPALLHHARPTASTGSRSSARPDDLRADRPVVRGARAAGTRSSAAPPQRQFEALPARPTSPSAAGSRRRPAPSRLPSWSTPCRSRRSRGQRRPRAGTTRRQHPRSCSSSSTTAAPSATRCRWPIVAGLEAEEMKKWHPEAVMADLRADGRGRGALRRRAFDRPSSRRWSDAPGPPPHRSPGRTAARRAPVAEPAPASTGAWARTARRRRCRPSSRTARSCSATRPS